MKYWDFIRKSEVPFLCNKPLGETTLLAHSSVCLLAYSFIRAFISLLHLAGIPARYVTGLVVGEDHIKIGVGRDAKDCTINRGIMHGGGQQTQTIKSECNKNRGEFKMIKTIASVGLPVDEVLSIKKRRIQPDHSTRGMKSISIVTGIHGDELEGQY